MVGQGRRAAGRPRLQRRDRRVRRPDGRRGHRPGQGDPLGAGQRRLDRRRCCSPPRPWWWRSARTSRTAGPATATGTRTARAGTRTDSDPRRDRASDPQGSEALSRPGAKEGGGPRRVPVEALRGRGPRPRTVGQEASASGARRRTRPRGRPRSSRPRRRTARGRAARARRTAAARGRSRRRPWRPARGPAGTGRARPRGGRRTAASEPRQAASSCQSQKSAFGPGRRETSAMSGALLKLLGPWPGGWTLGSVPAGTRWGESTTAPEVGQVPEMNNR